MVIFAFDLKMDKYESRKATSGSGVLKKAKSINQDRALKNSPGGYFSEGARQRGGITKH